MHKICEPSILYFGTPVVLISTRNADSSFNIAPISSVFWLGWRCIIGISAFSMTTENIQREKTCVFNLPSCNEVEAVNRLALTTGSCPVPEGKKKKGYHFVKDKFSRANLTPVKSETVSAPRILECPVQMEASLQAVHGIGIKNKEQKFSLFSMEFLIQRVHLEENMLMNDTTNRVDPDKWKPLIMSFQKFYSTGGQLRESTLAGIPEILYHSPETDRVRSIASCNIKT